MTRLAPDAGRPHIIPMADLPTEASYRIFEQKDKTFGVEVTITDMNPTMVTSFQTHDSAEAWITRHTAARAAGTTRKTWRKRQES